MKLDHRFVRVSKHKGCLELKSANQKTGLCPDLRVCKSNDESPIPPPTSLSDFEVSDVLEHGIEQLSPDDLETGG